MQLIQNTLLHFCVVIESLLFLTGCSFFFIRSSNASKTSGLKLVIDHDGGADDAIAIASSVLYEKYFNGPKVIALTATYGNTNYSQVVYNSARILKLCNRSEIPIYVGAQKPLIKGIPQDHYFGYDGIGDDGTLAKEIVRVRKVHAAVGLIELSKKYKGKLVVMMLGPATNVALAISLDPEFIGRLSQLYVGAGHIYSHRAFPKPEFNVAMDPEAYSIVAKSFSADKVTILPHSQVVTSLRIIKTWRKEVLGAINTRIIEALNGFERISLARRSSNWIPLDSAVAAVLLDPHIVSEYKYAKNGIVLCGDDRGVNTNNFRTNETNSRIVYSANVEKYKKRLVEIYSAELSKRTVS